MTTQAEPTVAVVLAQHDAEAIPIVMSDVARHTGDLAVRGERQVRRLLLCVGNAYGMRYGAVIVAAEALRVDVGPHRVRFDRRGVGKHVLGSRMAVLTALAGFVRVRQRVGVVVTLVAEPFLIACEEGVRAVTESARMAGAAGDFALDTEDDASARGP